MFSQGREFATGERLNELFIINGHLYANGEPSIPEFIQDQKEDHRLFGYPGASIVFQLKEKPDSTINQDFTFDFKFSDSESFYAIGQDFEVVI